MADLTDDFQFSIGDIVWGYGCDIFVPDGEFDPGEAVPRTQDTERPMADGLMFGRDFRSAPTWTWTVNTNHTELEDAEAALDDLEAAWYNTLDATEPGDHVELRYQYRGRTRLVYGRPRRFHRPKDNLLLQGLGVATIDFQRADPLHYGADEQQMVMGIVPSTSGGLISPLISPLISAEPAVARQGFVTVEGNAPTYPIITVFGPVSNPKVFAVDGSWEVKVIANIPAGQHVTVDARPWRMTAKLGGASVSLSRSTRLSDVRMEPGTHEIGFVGTDMTGSSTATVSWRPAWYSL